jgi:prepilin-type N-terminal cleavage/methylation domain-containing protein
MPIRERRPSVLDERLVAPRRGFTVLEVIVALAAGVVALLSARAMLTGIADGAHTIALASDSLDRGANGERLLRALVRQVETTADGGEFGGDERTVRFTTWCTVPGGWQERCRAAVTFGDVDGDEALLVMTTVDGILPLRRGITTGALRYIGDAARGGRWLHVWGEGISTPVALGIVLDADTLILSIGERP